MTEYFVLATLFVALVVYCVTGGADFGVGVVEMLSPKDQRKSVRKLSEKAIAPIWEANHVWIVLIIVILFAGFPKVHTALTTSMHIPFLIMLVGIVLRGTAFTFRYYDVSDDLSSEKLWTWLFRIGSVTVPMSFGAIAAALHSGTIPTHTTNVWDSYFAPWLTVFALSAGIFITAVFAWIATVFLSGEPGLSQEERAIWQSRARRYGVGMVLIGAVTSAAAFWQGSMSLSLVLQPVSIASVLVASVALAVVYKTVGQSVWLPRLAASGAIAAILAGYWLAHFPVALRMTESTITWHQAAASPASLNALTIALTIGLFLIGPGLAALYKVFKV